jgi:two-component system KDP operon response regulator KdpE
VSVIRHVREYSPVPIVVLSARTMEEQKVAALDAGADDYVTKPFSALELLARVRAALRRNARGSDQSPTLHFGSITVDLGQRTATNGAGDLHLTPLEYRVLGCLARNVGLIVTQIQLVREVWGPDRVGDTRSLRVAVKNLRHKLEPDPRKPRYLTTEAGMGYRLCVDDAKPVPAQDGMG